MRQCDKNPDRNAVSVVRQIEKNFEAVRLADYIRDGWTISDIAAKRLVSYQCVYDVLKSACPPFIVPTETKERTAIPPQKEPSRPAWTIPDKDLLRLAREARAEIEASGWFDNRREVSQ